MKLEPMKNYFIGMQKSWTVWFGYLLIVLPYIQSQWGVFSPFIPDKLQGLSYALIGLVVILLRFKTTQALDDKA